MTKTIKTPSQVTEAILEIAGDMRQGGLVDDIGYESIVGKLTKRSLPTGDGSTVAPLTGDDVRAIRERANISQAVLAHYLNVTVGYVSQLERGAQRPKGPTLVLLDVIRRKGLEAIS